MDITSVLAWIPGIAFFLLLFGRFGFPLLTKLWIKKAEEKGDVCNKCKGPMINRESYLYLIPVFFDHEHERSDAYYLNNAVPIASTEQIPTGNRACRIVVIQCQQCGLKEVGVIDFLKVREQEVLKHVDIFPYDVFREFLENNPFGSEALPSVPQDSNVVKRMGKL